jgi:hypothetical protein
VDTVVVPTRNELTPTPREDLTRGSPDRLLGVSSGNGNLRTLTPSKKHSTKINRPRIRLELVLRENWYWGDPLLCAGGLAFLMRRLRTLFHEETGLLSVRKIPFPELTPLGRLRASVYRKAVNVSVAVRARASISRLVGACRTRSNSRIWRSAKSAAK